MIELNSQKLRKKVGKLKHLVRQHDDVSVSESEPSSHLVLSNIGVDNGIPRGAILDLFQEGPAKDAAIQALHLGANRSFGYASFSTISDAVAARESIQGKTLVHPISGQPLVVVAAFVEAIPDSARVTTGQRLPEGLTVIEDFVDEEMERALLGVVEAEGEWTEVETDGDPSSQCLKHRRVRHFGYEFRYTTNDVDPSQPLVDDPMPSVCDPLLDRLVAQGRISERPDQLTVNRYSPGQGIPPHVDTHSAFSDAIFSLSLGSATVMDFKSLVDGKQAAIFLKPRSLLVMSGASRYAWTHAIAPRKFDVLAPDFNEKQSTALEGKFQRRDVEYRGTRTSFTFRKILSDRKCGCAFPEHCDTPRGGVEVSKLREETAMTPWQLEATHVHRVYDEIASHFSSTRHTPWPKVKEFVVGLEEGSVILDVGCGNGKYFGLMPQHTFFEVGCDRSLNLSAIAAQRGFNALGADALSLPFRDATFDAVISIAVVHHLTTPERRAGAIEEILRVTRLGGQILVTVWAFEQKRKEEGISKYLGWKEEDADVCEEIGVRVNENDGDGGGNGRNNNNDDDDDKNSANFLNVADLEIHENRTDFKQQDLLVPWHFKEPKQKKQLQQQQQQRRRSQEDEKTRDEAATPDRVFHRYYHMFKEGELENMVKSIRGYNVEVIRGYYDQGNWGVICRKL